MSEYIGFFVICLIIQSVCSLAQNGTSQACNEGHYRGSNNQCTLCPGGMFQNQTGANFCNVCPFGTISVENRTDCEYGYIGCFDCGVASLYNYQNSDPAAPKTLKACISTCIERGKNYAAITLDSKCYCVDNYTIFGASTDREDCSITCGIETDQSCGGPNRVSVYKTPYTVKTLQVPNLLNKKDLSDYGITAMGRHWISFQVRACADAIVNLMQVEGNYTKLIQIEIGEDGNTKTVIRNRLYSELCTVNVSPLNCNSFKEILLSWTNNVISLRNASSLATPPFIECQLFAADTFPINYIQFRTSSSEVCWRIYADSTTPSDSCTEPTTTSTTSQTTMISGTTTTYSYSSSPTTTYGISTILNTPSTLGTPSASSSVAMYASSTGDTESWCACPITNITEAELNEKIRKMKEELTVDVKSTSKYERKLVCAEDPRQSAMQLGVLLGPAVLATVFISLIIGDVIRVVLFIQNQLCGLIQNHW